MKYHNVQIMVKRKDYELIKKIAELRGLKVSVFMRMVALDAVRDFVTELTPQDDLATISK